MKKTKSFLNKNIYIFAANAVMTLTKHKVNFVILDTLRGLAALYVCIAHARGLMWLGMNQYLIEHPFSSWQLSDYLLAAMMATTKLSAEFVIFFFVLSGFSIAHSLSGGSKYLEFIKKRGLRLYPTYLLGLIWAGIVLYIVREYRPEYFTGELNQSHVLFERFQNSNDYFTIKETINNLIYNPNTKSIIAPYWSLVYEVIFYLLAPLFVLNLRRYGIISVLLFVFGFFVPTQVSVLNYFFNYNFYFCIGIFAYKNLDQIKTYASKMSITVVVVSSIIAMIVMVALESIKPDIKLSMLISALLSVFLIANILQKDIRLGFMEKIGGYSYTLYATHFQTILLFILILDISGAVNVSDLSNPFLWLTAVPVTVVVAYLFYLISERPVKNYLNRLRRS